MILLFLFIEGVLPSGGKIAFPDALGNPAFFILNDGRSARNNKAKTSFDSGKHDSYWEITLPAKNIFALSPFMPGIIW